MTDIERAKKVMLKLLIEFDRICSKHKLTYWLDFGTLLGAVRHQGFIPWDDDIDVSMPRKDYEKLTEIIQKELPKDMAYQHRDIDPEYNRDYSKLKDLKSIYHEVFYVGSYKGIFIDIFPSDIIDGKYKKSIKLLERYNAVNPFKKWFPSKRNRLIHILLAPTLLLRPMIRKLMKKVALNPKGNYYTKSLDVDVYGVYKKEYCDELIELTFEKHKFKVPKNFDGVLTALYGDYMKLPPIEDREYKHLLKITFLD